MDFDGQMTEATPSVGMSSMLKAALIGVSLLLLAIFGIGGAAALGMFGADDNSTEVAVGSAGESGNAVDLPAPTTSAATATTDGVTTTTTAATLAPTTTTTTAATPSTTAPAAIESVFSIAVGDCFDDPGSESVSTLPLRDCNEPHDNEVFALYDVTAATLPSQHVMLEGCFDRFEDAIGASYAESIYDFGGYTPGPESFADGDREVICYAFAYTGDPSVQGEKLVGSVIGSGL